MISKRSSMLSGISFILNWTKFARLELKSFSLTCQLVISLPNTSLTEVSSVLVEFRKTISREFPRPPVLFSKQQFKDLPQRFLEHAVNLKKFNLVTKDITCSLNVLRLNLLPWFLEVELPSILRRPRDL